MSYILIFAVFVLGLSFGHDIGIRKLKFKDLLCVTLFSIIASLFICSLMAGILFVILGLMKQNIFFDLKIALYFLSICFIICFGDFIKLEDLNEF